MLINYRLEYTRQDSSKKRDMCVDGPSPEFKVKVTLNSTYWRVKQELHRK